MKSMYPTTYLNQASRLLLLPAAWAYPAACSRRAQVILYGRDLTIAAYADKPTETSLTPDTVSLCVVPSLRHAVGVGGVGGVTAAVAVVGRCGDGGGDSVVVRVGGGGCGGSCRGVGGGGDAVAAIAICLCWCCRRFCCCRGYYCFLSCGGARR